jgi:hypothetical protein
MSREAEQPDHRSIVLTSMLTLMGGSLILFFLFVACGGLWIHVMAVIGGMAAFTGLQYLLWGRSMSAAVAKEQAAEQIREDSADSEREEAKEWTPEERSWYRRF